MKSRIERDGSLAFACVALAAVGYAYLLVYGSISDVLALTGAFIVAIVIALATPVQLVIIVFVLALLRPIELTRNATLAWTGLIVVLAAIASIRAVMEGRKPRRGVLVPAIVILLLMVRVYYDRSAVGLPATSGLRDFELSNLVTALSLFCALRFVAPKRHELARAFSILVIVISIGVASYVLSHTEKYVDTWNTITVERSIPLLGHLNFVGGVLVALFPLALLCETSRVLRIVVLITGTIGVLATGTRAAWIALLLVALVFAIQGVLTLNRIAIVAIALLLIAGVSSEVMASANPVSLVKSRIYAEGGARTSGRVQIWSDSIRVAMIHWRFGTGPAGFSLALAQSARHSETRSITSDTGFLHEAHNVYINMLAVFGLPLGIVACLGIVLPLARIKNDRSGYLPVLAGLCVFGIFQDFLISTTLTAMVIAVLALIPTSGEQAIDVTPRA